MANEYDMTLGSDRVVKCVFRSKVVQTAEEEKPEFFQATIAYGDMSLESATQLQPIFDATMEAIKKATGVSPNAAGTIHGGYDDLMCVQLLTAKMLHQLWQLGLDYATKKGILIPKTAALVKSLR